MKKLFTLAFAILCMASVFAANVDIIIKTNSEKIEAIIQEVSDTEIRYKKANNPNGPMFVIKLDDVSSVLYSNGEVQAIDHKAQPTPQQQYYGGYYGNSFYNDGPLQQIGSNLYFLEGKRLNGKELQFFLKQNCPVAYNYYHKWQKCENAGYVLMGVGAAVMLGLGLGLYGYAEWGEDFDRWDDAYYPCLHTGIAFMAIGGGMVAASIPLIACGNVNKKRVTDVYNANCARQQAFRPSLNLISGSNGLGLALSF